MNELSTAARDVIDQGLRFDGPSPERRERVKGRVLVALGGGVAAAGTVSSVAGAAGPVLAVGAGAKGLLGSSLVVWFATGLGVGVSAFGVAAVVQHVEVSDHPVHASAAKAADGPAPTVGTPPAPSPPEAPRTPDRELSPAVDLPSRDAHAVVPAPSGAAQSETPAVGTAANVPDPTSLSVEASLLQRAQRALAANQPDAALGLLAEHEARFPNGALAEERRVAKVLALCELGRVEEANILARAFVARAPNSVLIPRLESSCVGRAIAR